MNFFYVVAACFWLSGGCHVLQVGQLVSRRWTTGSAACILILFRLMSSLFAYIRACRASNAYAWGQTAGFSVCFIGIGLRPSECNIRDVLLDISRRDLAVA